MATVKEITDKLLGIPSFHDLRQRPFQNEPDELVKALEERKLLLAYKIRENSVADLEGDTEAQRTRAEADKLKAEIELLKLRTELTKINSDLGQDGQKRETDILNGVLSILTQDKAILVQENKELRDQIYLAITQEVANLRRELIERVSAPATTANGHKPIAETISELKAVREALLEIFPVPIGKTVDDLDYVIKTHEFQERHEIRMAEMRRQEREFEEKMKLDWAKFDEERKRANTLAQTLEKFAPAVTDAFKNNFMRGSPQATSGPYAVAYQQQNEANGSTLECLNPNCRTPIPVTPEMTSVVCPNNECRQIWVVKSSK